MSDAFTGLGGVKFERKGIRRRADTPSERMQMRILVISGFLGAGKTTFIQELVHRTSRRVVVYENEYGQADIDARILREDDEIKVWESLENCICCTGKQDFATSVLTIANTIDPDVLVVEPTGVAKLSSVMGNVASVGYERIQLLPPVAIVGADTWTRQHGQYPDIYLDQIASAATVVISKVDRAGTGEVEAAARWVRERNPAAEVVDAPYRELPDAWYRRLLDGRDGDDTANGGPTLRPGEPARDTGDEDAVAAGPDIGTLTIEDAELPTPDHLFWFLDALTAGTFGDIPRAKGIMPCGSALDEWLRFDVVDRAWAVTGAPVPEDEHAQAVFIGPQIRRTWLLEVLSPSHADAGHAPAGKRLKAALSTHGGHRSAPKSQARAC